MILPYWTNAPIYYYPIMTAVLIVLNCIISLFALLNPEYLEAMILRADGTLDPVTWLTSFFIHADLMHLFGNIIFLWCFGVIVEGRIGHIWMTICYLTVGLVQAAGLQLIMFAFSQIEPLEIHGALGASAAIYGLMVMAFLWSFDDDLISFVLLYPFYINYSLAVSLGIYCFIYLAFDLLEAVMLGWSSGLLHVLGAIVGLMVGVVVTATGLVKGDKPTFFQWVSTLPNRIQQAASDRQVELNRSSPEAAAANSEAEYERQRQHKSRELHEIKTLIAAGRFDQADLKMSQLVDCNPLASWDSSLMLAIIQGYTQQQDWPRADALIERFTRLFPNEAFASVRIRWIQIKLAQEMPRKALQIIQTLQGVPVTAAQKAVVADFVAQANHQIAAGVMEFE